METRKNAGARWCQAAKIRQGFTLGRIKKKGKKESTEKRKLKLEKKKER